MPQHGLPVETSSTGQNSNWSRCKHMRRTLKSQQLCTTVHSKINSFHIQYYTQRTHTYIGHFHKFENKHEYLLCCTHTHTVPKTSWMILNYYFALCRNHHYYYDYDYYYNYY